MKSRLTKCNRGQSTIEYVLMIGFGAMLSLQIVKFFNDVFIEGLRGLEGNVQRELTTGSGFTKAGP